MLGLRVLDGWHWLKYKAEITVHREGKFKQVAAQFNASGLKLIRDNPHVDFDQVVIASFLNNGITPTNRDIPVIVVTPTDWRSGMEIKYADG